MIKKTLETLELSKVSIVLHPIITQLEIQERILHKANEMFCKYGIRSVTMDDISKAIGVSKKTVYQFYPDKDELVTATMELNLGRHETAMLGCRGKASANAVQELLAINDMVAHMMQSYNPIMFYDLQKYFPKVWNRYREFRDNKILNSIKDNMNRGISEGLYRTDFDQEIVALMHLADIDNCFNYEIFPPNQFSFVKVMQNLTEVFLYGMVSLKGYKLINKYKNINED